MNVKALNRLERIARLLREQGSAFSVALNEYLADEISEIVAEEKFPGGILSVEEQEDCRRGFWINAIKSYRTRTGMGLRESKEAVEAEMQRLGINKPERAY